MKCLVDCYFFHCQLIIRHSFCYHQIINYTQTTITLQSPLVSRQFIIHFLLLKFHLNDLSIVLQLVVTDCARPPFIFQDEIFLWQGKRTLFSETTSIVWRGSRTYIKSTLYLQGAGLGSWMTWRRVACLWGDVLAPISKQGALICILAALSELGHLRLRGLTWILFNTTQLEKGSFKLYEFVESGRLWRYRIRQNR